MITNPKYLNEILNRLPLPGIWKPNLKYPYNFIYDIYSIVMLIYFVLFILSQLIEIYFLKDYNELIENLAVTLLCITTLGKIIVLKSNKIKQLIEGITKYESKLFKKIIYNFEKRQRNIYDKYIWYFHNLNVFLNVVGVITTFPFFIRPLIEIYLIRTRSTNNTTINSDEKPLPISSWFPFDRYEYYYLSYSLQVIGIAYAASSIVFIDGFFLGFMLFITGCLKILQDGLKNLKSDAQDLVEKNNLLKENEIIEDLVGNCIIEHNDIIRYVKDLDSTINILMLLDFAICSIQIAASGFWLIVTDLSVQLGIALIYFTAMLIQMFLFYGFADTVILESINLTSAIWDSPWYEFEDSVKKTLMLIMLRAQDPLRLSVGPFYKMSNGTALMILKTAYSYTTLLSKVYQHGK